MAAMQMGDIGKSMSSIAGGVEDIAGLFRGSSSSVTTNGSTISDGTQVTEEEVSIEKANEYIKQLLESVNGLAATQQGQKSSGLYNSTVNQQLTNDLLARTAGQVAALSSKKTTTQQSTQNTSNTNSTKKKGALEWIVCTELHKQGRLNSVLYEAGWPVFARTPVLVKRGYYLWAIPAVHHLRKHPHSLLSACLASIMNARANQIAGNRTVYGYLTLKGLYGICWVLSRTIARKPIDFMSAVYPSPLEK
jgi:hypothetical protein